MSAAVSVRVGGCYFHGEAGFEILGRGITAPARIRETNTVWFEGPLIVQPASQRSEDYPRDHAATLQLAKDAPLGVHHWRVWTSQGATPAMKFVVGELPEIIEHVIEHSGLKAFYQKEKAGADRPENLDELVNALYDADLRTRAEAITRTSA